MENNRIQFSLLIKFFFLGSILMVVLTGCGVKAPPLPPLRDVPPEPTSTVRPITTPAHHQ